MRDIQAITVGKYQLTEALIFAGFLSVAVGSFLLISEDFTKRQWDVVASAPQCEWDSTKAATIPQNLGPNLLSNPQLSQASIGYDAPMGWQLNSWGDIDASFSYSITSGYTDSTSVVVKVEAAGEEGDAKWEHSEPVPIEAEKSYLYRNYYQSDIATYTIAEFTYQDNSREYINLGVSPASDIWKETSYTIATPPGSTHLNLFQVITQPGFLRTDNYWLSQYSSPQLERGLVSLTFDDGARSTHANALPLLKKYDIVSTQFVVTGPLHTPYNNYHLTSTHLQDFARAGHEIGSHTVNHQKLTDADARRLNFELSRSKLDLYKDLGYTVAGFSVPYGSYSSEVLNQAKRYYCYHRSTDTGFNSPDSFDLYNIRVQNIEVTTPVHQVESWINYASENKVWLVIVFHEIDNENGLYSYGPENLEEILAYLSEHHIQTITVSQGVKAIQAAQYLNNL